MGNLKHQQTYYARDCPWGCGKVHGIHSELVDQFHLSDVSRKWRYVCVKCNQAYTFGMEILSRNGRMEVTEFEFYLDRLYEPVACDDLPPAWIV